MRIVKDAQERKNEILDVAERLFCTKGFDHTSTNDILSEIGIARGTLYYHFKSKEDILDAMIERIVEQTTARAEKIAGDHSAPVLERIQKTIRALNVENEVGHMIMEQVHRPQNALMHQKMQEQLLSRVNPIIVVILHDGIAQGIFHTDYPAEAAEMIMLYANTAFDTLAGHSQDVLQQKIAGFIFNTERILGTEEGALTETLLPIFYGTFTDTK
ncbi:MAG: TetR/AcrR family transcriptional regulator [Lachnospiraceae bacterium]|nr:TetR/AcrR family transcriptional regulator [Lachnospiraceae bacterium]MDD6505431.1 TetR/AcrR family transcriptional regulator [Lachnospiraceae bacterium]